MSCNKMKIMLFSCYLVVAIGLNGVADAMTGRRYLMGLNDGNPSEIDDEQWSDTKSNGSPSSNKNNYEWWQVARSVITKSSVKWAGDRGVDAFEDFLLRHGLQQKIDTFLSRNDETDAQYQCKVVFINGARILGDSALRATMSMTVDIAACRMCAGSWYPSGQEALNHFGHIASVELTANGIRSQWHQLVAIAPAGMLKDSAQFVGDSDALWRLAKELAVVGLLMRSKK